METPSHSSPRAALSGRHRGGAGDLGYGAGELPGEQQPAGIWLPLKTYYEEHKPPLQPLPATQCSVELYLAHLALQGTLAGSGFPQIVSNINTVHTLLGYPAPVPPGDSHNKQIKRGLAKCMMPLSQDRPREPFLAEFVQSVVQYGLSTLVLSELRDCFAVTLLFLFMWRGATVASLSTADMTVRFPAEDPCLRFEAREVKCRNAAVKPESWCYYGASNPDVLRLATRYAECRLGVFPGGLPDSLWELDRLERKFTTASVENMLHRVCVLVKVPPSVSEFLSTHSGRIGGASAMNAAGVPKDTIRVWGGWKHVDMCDVYIRSVPPSPCNALFFGWMIARPPAFRN